VSPLERHPYGPARGQHGELWLPEGDGTHPVAVLLHGGFWRAQHARGQMDALCADLVRRGWAAWNVEYRRLGRLSGGGFPRTLEDVAAAVDHLADLPAHPVVDVRPVRHRLDLDYVAAIGHSAGGQLATWLATRPRPRVRVRAVVAQAGVVDLRLGSELALSGGVVEQFLGGTPAQVPERYAAASPAERLPLGVPALLIHGGRDDVVPPLMSERFAAAARAAGDDVMHIVYAHAGHMEHLDPDGALWRVVAAWLDQRP
jgi:acetyl esterase/lipase